MKNIHHINRNFFNSQYVAQSFSKKINNFKFICSTTLWYEVISRVNVVSKMLQGFKKF